HSIDQIILPGGSGDGHGPIEVHLTYIVDCKSQPVFGNGRILSQFDSWRRYTVFCGERFEYRFQMLTHNNVFEDTQSHLRVLLHEYANLMQVAVSRLLEVVAPRQFPFAVGNGKRFSSECSFDVIASL